MSLTALPGTLRAWHPFDARMLRGTSFQSLTIDATGEKVAFGGRVFFQERVSEVDEEPFTKSIERIWFRFGTVVKAGGSGLTVSLQNMDLSAAADQPKPDEIQDQTVAIANGNASFASNTTIRTSTLSANRDVFFGEKLCIVIEFDGSGRQGSDSVGISLRECGTEDRVWTPWASLKSAGSWAASQHWPIVALEFDDGTFGTLEGVWMTDGTSSHLFHDGNSPDEYGLQFTMPFQCRVDAIIANVVPNGAEANFELLLYSGTSVVATVTVDADTVSLDHDIIEMTLDGEYTLNANVPYIIAVRPIVASNQVSVNYEVIADAGLMQLWGDADLGQVSRTNQGSWSALDQTKLPLLGVRVSGFHDDDLV